MTASTVRLYAAHSFFSKLFFFLPIIVLWFQSQGFSQFEVTLLLSSFFLSATITEIPSGVFADRYGHKLALFFCGFVQFIGMLFLAYSSHFFLALTGEVLSGIGYALYTGSKEAFLFNYLLVSGSDNLYQRQFARAKFFEFIGMACGSLVGGTVYVLWGQLPFFLSAGSFLASMLLALSLPEEELSKEQKLSSMEHLKEGWRHIRSGGGPMMGFNPLKSVIGFYCLFLTVTMVFLITLNQPYLRSIGVPLPWFGVLFLIFHVAAMGGTELASRLNTNWLKPRFFTLLVLALVLIFSGLSWVQSVWASLLVVFLHFCWGLFFPTISHATNRLIDSSYRGTVLATQDFLQNLLFVIVAPLLGLVADHWGLFRTTQILAGLSLLILPFARKVGSK